VVGEKNNGKGRQDVYFQEMLKNRDMLAKLKTPLIFVTVKFSHPKLTIVSYFLTLHYFDHEHTISSRHFLAPFPRAIS
jgi:hypothetical protein